jgi:radical SAM protein with 4Fe4S-binding SPASM domain
MDLTPETVLSARRVETLGENGVSVLVDRETPNWLATDSRGAGLLARFDGNTNLGRVVADYAAETGYEWAKAWQHVETIVRDGLRSGLFATNGEAYPGREPFVRAAELGELWIHTNNSCNLACSHCLVSSGPDGDPGLSTEKVLSVIEEARSLGAKRFYFTGGEPLVRKDFFEIAAAALADPEAELAVLTNGILIKGARLEMLHRLPKDRLRLQISLDGSTPSTNDPIRGPGSFPRIVTGIRTAVEEGFHVTVTTAITESNADDVVNVTRLIGELGGERHHLLWLHKRGRADGSGPDHTPAIEKVIEVVRAAGGVAREVGVVIDNLEALRSRVNSPRGVKRDLSNACVSSVCVYSDGNVYPSAATANIPELRLGSVLDSDLETVWRESEVAKTFRAATVAEKEICRTCPLKFLCGGGDVEHSYFYGGSVMAHDPYCELHKAMFNDVLIGLAEERRDVIRNDRSGFSAPITFTSMGEGSEHCASDDAPPPVVTSHSECVVSFDLDLPRAMVRDFYGAAAEEPQEELCCPVQPNPADISHIPAEVIERFYGCGSPVDAAEIKLRETTLDLGSGAGIDVFTAAKMVGPDGRAIGVDMTDQMLSVAHEAKTQVAANLGFDNVEFHKGFLEEIPVEDGTVDLVTSNCVLNLSPDKKKVFAEIWRVLADHGRVVVADIVSEEEVPAHQRRDPRLWGECISGALTEEEFLAYLERAGFYGVQVLRKSFWKEVEGHRFHSVTVRGYKFEKKDGCVFLGQRAIYQGPFKGIADEEGHYFPRGAAVEVCTDTVAKLSNAPYAGQWRACPTPSSCSAGGRSRARRRPA